MISQWKLSFLPRPKHPISNAMSIGSNKHNAVISDVIPFPATCIRQGSPKALCLVYDTLIEDPSILDLLFAARGYIFFHTVGKCTRENWVKGNLVKGTKRKWRRDGEKGEPDWLLNYKHISGRWVLGKTSGTWGNSFIKYSSVSPCEVFKYPWE